MAPPVHQARSGASQPATSPGATVVRVGSFNIGVQQSMLTAKSASKRVAKVEEIIATCVQEGSLDIFSLSELGGHRQGLRSAGICHADMRIFRADAGPLARVEGSYLTAWGFKADASHLGVKQPSLTCNLKSSETCDPQFVIQAFTVAQNSLLLHGNLHIRIPTGATVTTNTKKRVLIEAMRKLQQQAEHNSSSVSQPAVLVLVGDPNLTKEEAEEAAQTLQTNASADWQNVWQVHTTSAQRKGDIVLVKGAHAMSFDLPFGPSHRDRGVRKDQHDAIGVQLHIPSGARCGQGSEHATPRAIYVNKANLIPRSGASQPATSTHGQTRGRESQPATSRERSRTGGARGSEDVTPCSTQANKVNLTPRISASQPATSTHGQTCVESGTRHVPQVKQIPRSGASRPATPTNAHEPRPAVSSESDRNDGNGTASHLVLGPRDVPPRSGASQPATSLGAAARRAQDGTPQARNALKHEVAESVDSQMRMFWETHNPRALKETGDLRRILFAKTKHPVPDDLWIAGASQPGEQQYVVAVVSQEHVLRQLQGVLEVRHAWLQQQGLPLDFHMRDKLERPKFIEWVRNQYEQEGFQQARQEADFREGGPKRMRTGKRSRWSRELQRRCGSPALWSIISFSGRYDANFLAQVQATTVPQSDISAAQSNPTAGASQPEVQDNVPQQRTRNAQECRNTLRWAEHLARKRAAGRGRFSYGDQQLLRDFDTGDLLRQANAATRASGHGRLKNADGTFQDIGASTGGLARTVLDDWKPVDQEDQEEGQEDEEDAGMQEEEPVSW
jgi:hypothetical protein